MKSAKRAWLFFALCCIFLMGSSLFRTGILELKIANAFSSVFQISQDIKKKLHYAKLSLFSPEKLDALFNENQALKLENTLGKPLTKKEDFSSFEKSISFSKVLLRPLEKWSSSMWIARPLHSPFPVQEDCPVVAGKQLLGLVEKVEGNACFVRLLGDPLMKVAVELYHEEEKEQQNSNLWKLKTLRGDVEGMEPPYWGGNGNLMKGQLYLHPADRIQLPHPIPLEKMAQNLLHCTLVTSGLDGAFPKGLIVGKITKVIPPLEGECIFLFEAMPLPLWDDLFEISLLPRYLQADL